MSALSPTDFNHRGDLLPPGAPARPAPIHPPIQTPLTPTPAAQPTLLSKPTGPPVPALAKIGFWGSINDFNESLQTAHNAYVIANGVQPTKATILHLALQQAAQSRNPEQLSKLPPIGDKGHDAFLGQMKSITQGAYDPAANQQRHQAFNDFMQQHADVLQDMLNDPKTHAKTLAAINEAEDNLDFHGINGPGLSFGGAVKAFTTVPATWIGKTGFALGKDVDKLGLRAVSVEQNPSGKNIHSLKVAATFPNLTKAAPAVAQVVKGLVYSPAGIARAAIAMELDANDALNYVTSGGKKGDPGFKRTANLAKQVGLSYWQDLNDPGGRAGYALLDLFGLVSAGVGTATRLGRAGEAFGEAGAGAAAKAFVKPHALPTVEYSKGGYTENISLSGNPFAAIVQRWIPAIGTEAQIRQLADPLHDPFSWLRETRIGNDFTYGRGGVSNAIADALDTLNPTSPEMRMGRAGSIRRSTEIKALSANAQVIEDTAGYALRSTFLDSILPDDWMQGLTRGEVKALQASSWDVRGGLSAQISAEERTHQFAIESGMGSADAHRQQIADLALAREATKNPSPRFNAVLDAMKEATTKIEQMRIAYGMPAEMAESRVMEPGVFMDLAAQAQDTMRAINEAGRTDSVGEAQVAEMTQRLHDLKSSMAKLDVRFVPEDYKPPEFAPSARIDTARREVDSLQKGMDRAQQAEKEWMEKNKAAIAAAVKGQGREVGLDNPYRERILNYGERLRSAQEKVARMTTTEKTRFMKQHPPVGTTPGYYTKVGEEWVPVNRQTDDSFYMPILLRGHATPISRGNVRLPGSIFGIGKNSQSVWEDHQMTGRAFVSGDFRMDAHNLVGQGVASTVRAIVRMDAWDKAWNAARDMDENPELGPHEIYVRDIAQIPYEMRKSLAAFYEGSITQEQIQALPENLMKYLTPEAPKVGEHVRAIDQRVLGDLYFNEPSRLVAAGEPLVRSFTSPVNNTLRPLILYGPKYALNILGNESMLVFDQGFIRSSQNLARAFSMKDWGLEDDYQVMKKLAGAGKASAYMSGEQFTRFAKGSQALADFWSRVSDQEFRIASVLYYADRAGFKTPEEIHDLLTNEAHEAVRNDVVKRGNDAMVPFDRMSPIEKAVLRHFIFVYPWQRGALLWSFRSIFEHPMKASLLATIGQEEYTDDKWMKSVPDWVKRTGYIPFHWTGDAVHVLNPISVNTFSTLGDLLGTAKGLIEGDQYARSSDLFGPAGQFAVHAIAGVDSFGNPYKGSQLLGAIEDTLNMLPLMSAYRRSAKGTGKALRAYDVSNNNALANVLSSAMKATALDPGWLDGWGNIFVGGFSPRELNLTAASARYWIKAPLKERHAHQVDLIMRQLALQSSFLSTGKVPSDAEVSKMIMAPLNSVDVKGAVPEGVRQAVLDASQISYLAGAEAKNLGRTVTEKEKLLLSIRYYHQAGRMDEATFKSLTKEATSLDALPDIRAHAAQVAMNYGHLNDLREWDKRVRLQYSFMNPDTGAANFAQRIDILYTNGLAPQKLYNLNVDERGQYGHLYTQYVTERDTLRTKLSADKSLTPTQKALQLSEFDSLHDKPVKIGSRTLPSLAALGSAANWDSSTVATATDASQKRLNLLVSKNWYHLNSAEKAMFGRKVDPKVATGWDKYWTFLKDARDKGGVVDSAYRQTLAAYVNRYYAPGFLQDYLYASKTPKIDRFLQTKIYQSMPEKDTFDQIATYAKTYGKAMADGTSTISGTRKLWKAYVNQSLIPWLQKDHPDLYAWIEPLGTSWLTSMINTG